VKDEEWLATAVKGVKMASQLSEEEMQRLKKTY